MTTKPSDDNAMHSATKSKLSETEYQIHLGDIDIDVADRDVILRELPHTCVNLKGKKHNTSICVHDIPFDPETGLSEPEYKIDIINYGVLKKFLSNDQLTKLIELEPDWELLKDREFVEQTTHIHRWYDLIKTKNINSVDRMAMFLGIIRPGKEHLKNSNWDRIEKEVWLPTEKYNFKKSHAYGYALTIVALMNLYSGK